MKAVEPCQFLKELIYFNSLDMQDFQEWVLYNNYFNWRIVRKPKRSHTEWASSKRHCSVAKTKRKENKNEKKDIGDNNMDYVSKQPAVEWRTECLSLGCPAKLIVMMTGYRLCMEKSSLDRGFWLEVAALAMISPYTVCNLFIVFFDTVKRGI